MGGGFAKPTNFHTTEKQWRAAQSLRPPYFFDPTGRLILESDDPAIASEEFRLGQEDQDVRHGIMTINELRNNRGLEPVAWGHEPWLPLQHAPPSFDRRQDTTYAPQIGRAKPEQDGNTSET